MDKQAPMWQVALEACLKVSDWSTGTEWPCRVMRIGQGSVTKGLLDCDES